MKHLLGITAALEAATGAALVATPSLVARLLLGSEIAGVSIPLGRVAGLAFFALAIAC